MIKGKIRRAKNKDLLNCQNVIYNALEIGCSGDKQCIIKHRKTYSLINIKKYFKNSKVFVFEYNKKIIATGRLTKDDEIRMIYVEPKFHNKGAGTQMINFLEKVAQKKKIKKVHLHSLDSAIGFYLKEGFQKVKGFVKRDNRMDKELGVKIRKAMKKDFDEYLRLRKLCNIEYTKITSIKINVTEKQIKKEFETFVSSPKQMILFAEEKSKIIGYIAISIYKGLYKKIGFVDDIFVLKEFRKKKVATKLINEFMNIMKNKKVGYIRLGVNPKNKVAQKLYKKLGFKITHYEMEKRLK